MELLKIESSTNQIIKQTTEETLKPFSYHKAKWAKKWITRLFNGYSSTVVIFWAIAVLIFFLTQDKSAITWRDFLNLFFNMVVATATGIYAYFVYTDRKHKAEIDPRLPSIEASFKMRRETMLIITFTEVPKSFVLYKVQLPSQWIFYENETDSMILNRQIHFNMGNKEAQEVHLFLQCRAVLPEDYCLRLRLFTSIRDRAIETEAVDK